MVATSCDLNAPGAPPRPSRYVCTGPGEVSSLVTDPPGTPMTPCIKIYNIHIINMMNLQNFTSVQTFHTHTTLSHTQLSLTHNPLSHTQVSHTQLSLTHKSLTHNSLSHTQLSHIHTTLSHTTPSHTHNSLTHTHNNSLTHTQLSHTHNFLTRNSHTRPALCVASVALMALGWLWWALGCRRCRRRCLCGKRGAWWHRPSLCVAGVALGDIGLHFVWQAWHLWQWAGSGGSRLSPWTPRLLVWQAWLGDIDFHFGRQSSSSCTLCGRRGTSRLSPWTPRLFVWQAWHLATSTFTLCGRRGAWRHSTRGRRGTWQHWVAPLAWYLWEKEWDAVCEMIDGTFAHTHTHTQPFHASLFHWHLCCIFHPSSTCKTSFICNFHMLFPTIFPAHCLSLSCLSHLVFTSSWRLLEEVDM